MKGKIVDINHRKLLKKSKENTEEQLECIANTKKQIDDVFRRVQTASELIPAEILLKGMESKDLLDRNQYMLEYADLMNEVLNLQVDYCSKMSKLLLKNKK